MTPRTSAAKKGEYREARGGRKTAVARVRLTSGVSGIVVNGKDYASYFRAPRERQPIEAALAAFGGFEALGKKGISVVVRGGGIMGQAQAVRHGMARIFAALEPASRGRLKVLGFLTRDPRMVERKKYGLKKARRAPQWSKR